MPVTPMIFAPRTVMRWVRTPDGLVQRWVQIGEPPTVTAPAAPRKAA